MYGWSSDAEHVLLGSPLQMAKVMACPPELEEELALVELEEVPSGGGVVVEPEHAAIAVIETVVKAKAT